MGLFGLRQPAYFPVPLAVSFGPPTGPNTPRQHSGEGRHRLERADPLAAEVGAMSTGCSSTTSCSAKAMPLSRMGLESIAEGAD